MLAGRWLDRYDATTPWKTNVVEVRQEDISYLFDAAPTLSGAEAGDDRVVAAWGLTRPPSGARDHRRQAGFIANPPSWSGRGHDRGHFVAHAAGGGMDLNFFPQARGLNRGTTPQGRTWRAMERYGSEHPGTPLFVRPVYLGESWVPAAIDYGLLTESGLWHEHFENRD